VITAAIPTSESLDRACQRFLDELGQWVHSCVRRYGGASPTRVHDQATYTTSWLPWIRARGGAVERRFLATLRDRIASHFHRVGQWRHGYWRMHDVHHGTEHFELFLGALWRLDRDDDVTVSHVLDAVEHMGNWSSRVPEWFDWNTGLFHSRFLGTDGVRPTGRARVNVPDHLRCVNLSLLAYDMTGMQRYLRLAVAHAGRWADAITGDSRLPLALAPCGPIYSSLTEADLRARLPERRRPLMSRVARSASKALYRMRRTLDRSPTAVIETPRVVSVVDRAESFLASNGVATFIHVWRLTGQRRFRDAAERLIDILVTQLGDPDAGAVANAVRAYRNSTGDNRFDGRVLDEVDRLRPWGFAEVAVNRYSPRFNRQPGGVGKRKDMLAWLEDGRPRRHSPMLLALAAEIRHDEALAIRAVDLARTCFMLARRTLPDGRGHGCAARTVSAVARGHGRDNDTGVVSGVLAPMLDLAAG
jgi:hypothetical protein